MSYLGNWADLEPALGSEGATAFARGAIISGIARDGGTIGSVQDALQAAGISFRRQDISRAFHQVLDQINSGVLAAQIPFDQVLTGAIVGNPPANWTGQYQHVVTATFRHRNDDGSYTTSARNLGVIANDVLDPLSAVGAAMNILSAPVEPGEEDRYPRIADLMSLSVTGVWWRTNPGATGRLAS